MIPKIFYTYWDGSPLSFLQYLTVKTFKDLNPDWEINLYMPKYKFDHISFQEPCHKISYTGINYLDKLKSLDITIKYIDFEEIGFKNDVSEVFKADYVRYWLLGNYGGVWSDMDVLYIKPIDSILKHGDVYGEIDNIDTVICTRRDINYFFIGFLMSSKNNKFYLDLLEKTNIYLDPNVMQSIGPWMIKKIFNDIQTIKGTFKDLNILDLNEDVIYPFIYEIIPTIFYEKTNNITENTIGIHWFNGVDANKKIQNLMGIDKIFPKENSIYPYIKKYLDEENIL